MDEQKRPPLPDELQQLLGITARQPKPSTRPQLTRGQRQLVGAVAGFVGVIAAIGFAGSYTAVTKLAQAKGFGWFAWAFPAGIDSGIGGFLALDLLLTWLRMPYPLLRYIAWALTAGTICFNASAAWGDWLAVGMHGVVPLLFVAAIEAARHATGRVADITADRFIESPPLIRWILDPVGTFQVWRRMRLWQMTSYLDVIRMERERKVFRTQLRRRYGFWWRSKAADHEVLALLLARYGTPVHETLAAHPDAVQGAVTDRAAELAGPDHTTVGPDRTPAVDRPADRTEAALEATRTTPVDRTADTVQPDRTAPDTTAQPGPARTEKTARPKRTAPADRTETQARTAGPDRSTTDLELNDTEQAAIDRLRSTDRSISKRSIADVVRNELGQSIGSDRAAEIARHFRTLKAA